MNVFLHVLQFQKRCRASYKIYFGQRIPPRDTQKGAFNSKLILAIICIKQTQTYPLESPDTTPFLVGFMGLSLRCIFVVIISCGRMSLNTFIKKWLTFFVWFMIRTKIRRYDCQSENYSLKFEWIGCNLTVFNNDKKKNHRIVVFWSRHAIKIWNKIEKTDCLIVSKTF